MTDHHLQDLGGHSRLLVIHFLVWKLRWKFGDYPVERCSKQMDQQSNLQVYGLLINLLSVGEFGLRAETSNPLGVKDECGLHPPALRMPRYHHLESFDNVMHCLQLLFLLLYVNSHAIARICL
uniref:Uncharacterized protein n=1 Tax=Populus trichocarpa TaxID=3694 RepID=A0A2K1YMS0_POPTR